MTKEEIRKLIDKNDKLQWWAAVLFSEIAEQTNLMGDVEDLTLLRIIKRRVDEFPWHVQQEAMKIINNSKTNQSEKIDELEQRIITLEKKVK
jgi:hypothetical protein